MPLPEQGFREIDFRAGVCAAVSAIVYLVLTKLIPGADNYLNICVMGIAGAFLAEMDLKKTIDGGITRFALTGIGILVGFVVVFLDGLTGQNDFVIVILYAIGIAVSLVLCKLSHKMYIQCKICTVSFTLTVFTFRGAFYAQMGKTCYGYGIMFAVSTAVTALVCAGVIAIWDKVRAARK